MSDKIKNEEQKGRLAIAMLGAMVHVWGMVAPIDFAPAYWIEKARLILDGKDPFKNSPKKRGGAR